MDFEDLGVSVDLGSIPKLIRALEESFKAQGKRVDLFVADASMVGSSFPETSPRCKLR
jgi:hypothetical protein